VGLVVDRFVLPMGDLEEQSEAGLAFGIEIVHGDG
jgi:hypothetical protein